MQITQPMNPNCMIDVAKALKVIGETVYKMGAFIEPEITIAPHDGLHEEGKDAPTVSIKITFFSPIRLHEYIAQLTPQEGGSNDSKLR